MTDGVDCSLDFEFVNHGSIVLLNPLTDAARDWLEENISEDFLVFANATAIEPRYVVDIAHAISDAGLTSNMSDQVV